MGPHGLEDFHGVLGAHGSFELSKVAVFELRAAVTEAGFVPGELQERVPDIAFLRNPGPHFFFPFCLKNSTCWSLLTACFFVRFGLLRAFPDLDFTWKPLLVFLIIFVFLSFDGETLGVMALRCGHRADGIHEIDFLRVKSSLFFGKLGIHYRIRGIQLGLEINAGPVSGLASYSPDFVATVGVDHPLA